MRIYFEDSKDEVFLDISLDDDEIENLRVYQRVTGESIWMNKPVYALIIRKDQY